MATEIYVAISSTDRTGQSVVGGGGATYSASFTTIDACFADATYGYHDISLATGADEIIHYQVFKDGSPYITSNRIDLLDTNYSSDGGNYVVLESALGEWHLGIPSSGVVIQHNISTGFGDYVCKVDSHNLIQGLEFVKTGGSSNNADPTCAVWLLTNGTAKSVIAKAGTGSFRAGFRTQNGTINQEPKLISCLSYESYWGYRLDEYSSYTGTFLNCVALNYSLMGFNRGSGVYNELTFYNCIAVSDSGTGYNIIANTLNADSNASIDATAVGTNPVNNLNASVELPNYAANNPHLDANSASLVGTGYDVSAYSVDIDIDGQPFSSPYSIGCDEPEAWTVPCIFNGVPVNTEIRIYKNSDNSELIGVENSTADPEQLDMPYSLPENAYVVLINPSYKYFRQENLVIGGSGIDLPLTIRSDRDYSATSGVTGISFNTATKKITVSSVNDFQDLYSYSIEQWKADANLPPHDFPFDAYSANAGEYALIDGWDFDNDTSRHNTRSGAWSTDTATWMNVKTLGTATGQPYYTNGGSPVNTVRTDTQDTVIDITSNNTAFKMFLREQGKTFDEYDLISEQNITNLVAKTYFVPLANESDSKISASDTTIEANTPYTGMTVTYLDGHGFTAWEASTAYTTNAVVSNAGRWYLTAAGGTDASTFGDTVTWVAYTGEREIDGSYYPFNIIFNGNSGLKTEIYEKHQHMMRQATEIATGVIGKTADLLMYFLGDVLYTNQGCYIDNFLSAEQLSYRFTDATGTVRQFPAPDSGITFNNLIAGSQVKVFATGTTTERFTTDNSGTSENYVATIQEAVDYTIMKSGYRPIRVTGYTIAATPTTLSIQQQEDRAYQSGVTFVYGTDGDYTVNTFNVSKIMTVQQYYSAMIDAWIAQATLKNTHFPITPNGGNSFSFDDCSINESQFETKLYRDGVRVTSGGTVTDMWAAIWTNLPSSDTAEIQQISGASFTDIPQVGIRKGWNAPSGTQSGTVDMLLKIYGGSGTLDYTDYLVVEYAVAGKYQGRVVAHDTYSPLQDELYVLPVAPTDSPIPATDPALVNPPTIEFAPNGTPVSWKGYNWYITIKDSAVGNSGADIANWFNYHIREQNDSLFEGKDPFNYWDCIRDNGAKWKTIRGILWGDYGDTEVGVRVVDTNYEPHPDFNSMIANDGSEYVPPVLATREVTNLPNAGVQRLQIYNKTTGLEVYNSDPNSVTYSETYENGTGISANDSIRITFTEINGGISFKSFRTVVTASSDGFSVDASNFISSDSVYAANAIDGTTITKFTADYVNDEIDVSASADFSAAEAYAFYCATLNTSVGIYDFWGGITAIDTGNYRINTSVVNLYIDETQGTSKKQTDEARIFRDDDLYPVKEPTTSGYGVQINWKNVVYVIETGVSGVTAQDKVDIAEEIMNYTV